MRTREKIEKRKQLIKLLGRTNYTNLIFRYDVKIKGDKIILTGCILGFNTIAVMNSRGYDFISAKKRSNSYKIDAVFKRRVI